MRGSSKYTVKGAEESENVLQNISSFAFSVFTLK
jgi:hypothetical protein